MGEITNNPGKGQRLLRQRSTTLKNLQLVKSEIHATPGMQQYDVQTLDEWLSFMTPDHLPGFNIALRIVIGIAVVIGFLAIFQSMYTAVMERTREIGVLKSLGASKIYVVSVVMRETGLLALIGIALGVGATYLLRAVLHVEFPKQDFAVTPGLGRFCNRDRHSVGAMLGAFYPALKAAPQGSNRRAFLRIDQSLLGRRLLTSSRPRISCGTQRGIFP